MGKVYSKRLETHFKGWANRICQRVLRQGEGIFWHLKSIWTFTFLTNFQFCLSKPWPSYPCLQWGTILLWPDCTNTNPVFSVQVLLILWNVSQSANTDSVEILQRCTSRSLTYEDRTGNKFVNSEQFCKRIDSVASVSMLGIKQHSDKVAACSETEHILQNRSPS